MKKIKRLLCLLVLTIIMLVSLSGCGAGTTVNTTLTLENDLSGTRTMQMVFTESTFKQYFKGTIEDLNTTVFNHIPAEMTYEITSSNGNYYLDFYLGFSSADDYISKVNTITSEEHEITITCPDSVWVSGIFVDEDFTSTDLLAWLSDALVAEGQLSSSYVSNLFGSGSTYVVYNGDEISSSTEIYVDEITYEQISKIEVFTDIIELGKFNRKVIFTIPEKSMNNKGDKIRAYMAEVTPENGTMEETTLSGETLFSYVGEALDAEGIESFMSTIFGAENCEVENTDVDECFSPFTFSYFLDEKYMLTNYVVGNASTTCYYYVNTNDATLEYWKTKNFSTIEGTNVYAFSENHPEYSVMDQSYYYGGSESYIDIPLLVQKVYKVAKVEVETDKGLFSEWERNVKFSLAEVPLDEEQEVIVSKIEGKLPVEEVETEQTVTESTEIVVSENTEVSKTPVTENAESEALEENSESYGKVKVASTSKDVFTVTIKQTGTIDELELSSTYLFGTASSMFHAKESGLVNFSKIENYIERFTIGNYAENITEDYQMEYKLSVGSSAKVLECNLEESTYTLEKGNLIYETSGNAIYVDVLISKLDVCSVLFVLFLVVGVALIVFVLYRSGMININLNNIVGKVKTSIENAKNGEEGATSEAYEKGTFCPNCGAHVGKGTAFCGNCGKEITK